MSKQRTANLSRRERQIMDILYRRKRATAAEIHKDIPDPPSYSTVRTILRVLDEKGHLKQSREGRRYVYMPRTPAHVAKRSALRGVLTTFFDGSVEKAMATMLDMSSSKLSSEDFERLSELIEQAKEEESS